MPAQRLIAWARARRARSTATRGIVTFAPNLKGWTKVPMRDILERALGAPVLVENDVNLAVLGEHWQGAARGHDTCAFVFVGTGIGAGILIDGELHRGHHFMAGEIAVMCMGPQFVDVDYGDARLPRDAGRPAGAGRALAPGARKATPRTGWPSSSRPRDGGDRARAPGGGRDRHA